MKNNAYKKKFNNKKSPPKNVIDHAQNNDSKSSIVCSPKENSYGSPKELATRIEQVVTNKMKSKRFSEYRYMNMYKICLIFGFNCSNIG